MRIAPPPATEQEPAGILDGGLLPAVLRTVQLLDAPQDIPALAPHEKTETMGRR